MNLRREVARMDRSIVLILHSGKNNLSIMVDMLYILTNHENIPGVCVSVVRPYDSLEPALEKKGVDTDKIIFIDAVTRTIKEAEDTARCIYVDNPKKLIDINLYIDAALAAITFDEKFVFFDSLSTLAIFNQIKDLERFFYFLTSKMRVNSVKGIFLSLNKDKDKGAIKEVTKYCDRIIEI